MTRAINKKNTYQCSKCGIHFRTYQAILVHDCVMDFAPVNIEGKKNRIKKINNNERR